MPPPLVTPARECLKSVSPSWLLPNLFKMIWSRLRSKGEENSPDWSLGMWLRHRMEEEDGDGMLAERVPEDIRVKHAVNFFYLIVQTTGGGQ